VVAARFALEAGDRQQQRDERGAERERSGVGDDAEHARPLDLPVRRPSCSAAHAGKRQQSANDQSSISTIAATPAGEGQGAAVPRRRGEALGPAVAHAAFAPRGAEPAATRSAASQPASKRTTITSCSNAAAAAAK
jgi:hypothetical protein